MPRAGTSSVVLLTMMSIRSATLAKLPPRNSKCWLEAFEDMCLFLVVHVLLLNIFVEVIWNKFKREEFARTIQRHSQRSFPIVFFFGCLLHLFFLGSTYVDPLIVLSRVLTVGYFLVFIAYHSYKLRHEPPPAEQTAAEE